MAGKPTGKPISVAISYGEEPRAPYYMVVVFDDGTIWRNSIVSHGDSSGASEYWTKIYPN